MPENTSVMVGATTSQTKTFTNGTRCAFDSVEATNHTAIINLQGCTKLDFAWSVNTSSVYYYFFADGQFIKYTSTFSKNLTNYDVSDCDYMITTRVYDGLNRSMFCAFTAS